jgi:hypothetical protein
MQKGNYTEIEDDFRYAWFKNENLERSLLFSLCILCFIRPSLESFSWYDRISVLSGTSSARNSLYIWSWKHHYWGAIRIIYREFRACDVSNKSLIRSNHRSKIINWWYSPYYIIIDRIIGCFGVIWMNLILVIWIKQEKYCDIERAAGAPAQISRTKVRFKDFT